MGNPSVSVLLCSYNAEKYIAEAITSILNQTYRDFELVIVLDAPTDGTENIVRSFGDPRIKIVLNEKNLGLTKSLNIGLARCKADLIVRQDADDVSLASRIEKQINYLNAHPEVILLGTASTTIDSKGRKLNERLRPLAHEDIAWYLCFENPFVHSAVCFRKESVLELGGYDESYRRTQDFDLWSKIVLKGRVANLEEPLVLNRVHGDSISAKNEKLADEYSDAICFRLASHFGCEPRYAKAMPLLRHSRFAQKEILAGKLVMENFYFLASIVYGQFNLKPGKFVNMHRAELLASLAVKSAAINTKLALQFFTEWKSLPKEWRKNFSYFRFFLRLLLREAGVAWLKSAVGK